MSITAKSVVFDCADTYTSISYLGLRAVEFLLEGVVVNPAIADFTAYQSSQYSASYSATNVFNTLLSKTGSYTQGWITATGVITNQRCIIVFDTPLEFDTVVINNQHLNGGATYIGVKNVVITSSTDEITSTTYEDTITNATVLFDGIISEHIPLDLADDREYYSYDNYVGITSKSVVLDIADQWGGTNNLGVRSVEFLLNGKFAPGAQFFTADATTEYSATYQAEKAFTDYLPKTGSYANGWLTPNAEKTDQRLLIVFDNAIVFDEIVINNLHTLGTLTDSGIKNTVITSSTDEITSTTYEDTITNPTILYDGIVTEHPATDTADDQTYYEYEAPVLGLLGVLRQTYDLETAKILVVLSQTYDILYSIIAELRQPYGDSFFAVLSQQYGDMPILLAVLKQFYGDNPALLAILKQEYRDLDSIQTVLKQPYSLMDALLSVLKQRYHLTEPIPPGVLKQVYDLLLLNEIQSVLNQPYSLFADLSEDPVITTVKINGESVHVSIIDFDYDIDIYCATFNLTLPVYSEWLQLDYKMPVVVTINGLEHHTIVVELSDSQSIQTTTYTATCRSQGVLLDFPFATEVSSDFVVSGTASEIVNDLAALEGLSITWQLDSDPPLTEDDIYPAGDSPLSSIVEIINELGGRLHSDPTGNMYAIKRYSVNTDKYAVTVPVYSYSTGEDYTVLNTDTDKRYGHNRFSVSHDNTVLGYRLDYDDITESKKQVKAFNSPWSSSYVFLETSELTNVKITPHGSYVESEQEDLDVEIIEGNGSTTLPYYGLVSVDYKSSTNLGSVSVKEDGTIKTQIQGQTLVDIKYTTRYWSWDVTGTDAEVAQFILVKP